MITIGNHELKQQDTYIIAEIGSNWERLEDLLQSVKMAKVCGANAVKLQLFNYIGLYGEERKTTPSWYNKKHELPLEWLQPIHEVCDECAIHLIVSVFDPDLVRQVDPYVPAHKIASSEVTNLELLEMTAACGKPIFLSCGAATFPEIQMALSVLSGSALVLNYCVAAYPSYNNNLFVLDELAKFGYPVGFSDHSKDYIYLPRAAVKFHNAVSIEKHFCANSSISGPDVAHSLRPAQFKAMSDFIKGKRSDTIGPVQEEADFMLRHKRRLVAKVNIKQGDILNYGENFGAYRSKVPESDYISPFAKGLIDNKPAKNAIQAGRAISALDF